MPKSDPYNCPKCGYKTMYKRDMKKHFYCKKTPCANNLGVDLTSEIMEYVLIHRKYQNKNIKKEDSKITYNNNNITNYVNSLDTLTKLNYTLEYKQKQLIDINDYVESQHQSIVEKLENDEFRYPHFIEQEKLLVLIDDMVKIDKSEEMNVIYDEMLDRIKIFCDDEWEVYMVEPGMRRIVDILRTNYLDPYECYLYKKTFHDRLINGYQLNNVRIRLEDYYKFLAIFDLRPYVYDKPISFVIPNYKTENPDEFRDYGMKKYEEVKKTLSKTQTAYTKRMIMDIIKRNHKVNLKKLNKTIIDILKLDDDFRKSIMPN